MVKYSKIKKILAEGRISFIKYKMQQNRGLYGKFSMKAMKTKLAGDKQYKLYGRKKLR
jgi:hypothetical protein